jgi:transposase
MAYSVDYRKRVIEYLDEGHSQTEAQEVFKVGTSTMKGWKKLLLETGKLEKRELSRKARIFESDKLEAYMEEHPQALLKDIAKHFGGSTSGAADALERGKITLKKQHQPIANEAKKSGWNSIRK